MSSENRSGSSGEREMEDNIVSSTSGDDYTGTTSDELSSAKCQLKQCKWFYCDKTFPFERQVLDHFKGIHLKFKRYTCNMCFSKSYTTLLGSKWHRENCAPSQMEKHQKMWKSMEVVWVTFQMKSKTCSVQTDKLDDKFAQVIFIAYPSSEKIAIEIEKAVEQKHLPSDCVICGKHFPHFKDLTDHYKYYVDHKYKHVISELAKSNPGHQVWKRYNASTPAQGPNDNMEKNQDQ